MTRSLPRAASIALAGLLLAACAGGAAPSVAPTASPVTISMPSAAPGDAPSAAPSEAPPAGGLTGLVAALEGAGAVVEPLDGFDGSPLSPNGSRICVDGEPVRAYVYSTPVASAEAASMIDPTDPTHIGTSIVEWDGSPRFWLFDTVLLLYLGADEATETRLTSVFGEPFARGAARQQRLPDSC